ncbi:MAG: endospore germination permease [Firmicutes bacterium]|nr:endospore germination permease [Bacillota bacterium]
MIPQGKIGSKGAVIVIAMFIALNFFFAPTIASTYGFTAAWLVVLLAGLLAMLAAVLPWLLMRKFPDQTIIEVGYTLAGKYLGFIINLLIFNYFLLDMVFTLRISAERIQVAYLPVTPLEVVMLTLLLVGVGGACLGLESIARSIVIASGLLLASILIPIILTYNFWNAYNFFPLLGSGFKPIAIGGISMIGVFSDVIMLALIYPSISKSQGGKSNLWSRSVLWGMVLGLVMTVGSQLLFPYLVLNESLFPFLQVSRIVYLGRFVQRLDVFLAFFWFGAYALRFAMVYLLTMFSLAQLLRLPYHHPFLYSLGVIAFTLALIPHDIVEATNIVSGVFWRTSWLVAFILPGVLLLVSQFRGREGAK